MIAIQIISVNRTELPLNSLNILIPAGTPSCNMESTLATHIDIINSTKTAIKLKAMTSFFSARNFNFIQPSP